MDLLRAAFLQNMGNLLNCSRPLCRTSIKKQFIRSHLKRRSDINQHRKTQFRVSGLNMTHMCRGNSDLLR